MDRLVNSRRAGPGDDAVNCSEPAPSDMDRLSRLVGDYVKEGESK